MGNPEHFGATYKKLIEAGNCVVVAPDYQLSIDAPYPAALEDCYDTLLWMKSHTKDLGIRADQLMVGGESAGGGLTYHWECLGKSTCIWVDLCHRSKSYTAIYYEHNILIKRQNTRFV